MHTMAARPRLDLATRAEKCQFHSGTGPASLMLAVKHYPTKRLRSLSGPLDLFD
jgi:hypothetical protein